MDTIRVDWQQGTPFAGGCAQTTSGAASRGARTHMPAAAAAAHACT
jgi:hypothetical protein